MTHFSPHTPETFNFFTDLVKKRPFLRKLKNLLYENA